MTLFKNTLEYKIFINKERKLIKYLKNKPKFGGVDSFFIKNLNKLGFSNYKQYLQSEHWINFKANYYKNSETVKWMLKKYGAVFCEFCKRPGILHLHHKTYKNLGKERIKDIFLLCVDCHSEVHNAKKNGVFKNLLQASIKVGKKHHKIKTK